MTLEEKLRRFDDEAARTLDALFVHLHRHRAAIIAKARERHISGHAQWGDGLLFELTHAELEEERDQELADGLVYEMVRRRLASDARGPSI